MGAMKRFPPKFLLPVLLPAVFLAVVSSCEPQVAPPAPEAQQVGTTSPEERIRELLNEAGTCYYTSDYRMAYQLLIEALSLCERHGNTTYEAQIYANMGNIYSRFNKYDMAKRYYTKALELHRDSVAIVATLNNLGSAELESGQADSALWYMRRASDISGRHDDIYRYSIRNNIARFHKDKQDYDSAFRYFHLSLDEARRRHKVEKEAEILSNLGEVLLETGRVDSALHYTKLSNGIATEHDFSGIETYNYLTLSRIAEARHDDGRALALFKRHIRLRDSLLNAEKFGEINQLQRLYDVSKTDAHIAHLLFERQMKERTIVYHQVVQAVILVALIVVVAILIHVFRQKRALNKAHHALVEKNLQIIDLQDEAPPAGTEKYRKSALSHDRHGELLERILSVMEDTAVICDTKFTIDKLSELAQSNQTYISQVINETQGKNFRSFLNAYRIREAQRIFAQPDAAKYTIEAVALQVGFLSRTTFRDAFKEVTGVSPSVYLKFLLEGREA